MATINNLEDAANDFLQGAAITETPQTGVSLATDGGITAFTSGTNNVDLMGSESNNVVLTGNADLDVTGSAEGNVIAANNGDNVIDAGAGNDEVSTGAGDDTIALGDGDDVVTVDGGGTKTIDGGAGNDVFIITPVDAMDNPSSTTFTGLNMGDSVRLTVVDTNNDGVLDFSDVDIAPSDNGSLTFTLGDGTSFTLDGIGTDSATNGDINYSVIDNGDGTWDVAITG